MTGISRPPGHRRSCDAKYDAPRTASKAEQLVDIAYQVAASRFDRKTRRGKQSLSSPRGRRALERWRENRALEETIKIILDAGAVVGAELLSKEPRAWTPSERELAYALMATMLRHELLRNAPRTGRPTKPVKPIRGIIARARHSVCHDKLADARSKAKEDRIFAASVHGIKLALWSEENYATNLEGLRAFLRQSPDDVYDVEKVSDVAAVKRYIKAFGAHGRTEEALRRRFNRLKRVYTLRRLLDLK